MINQRFMQETAYIVKYGSEDIHTMTEHEYVFRNLSSRYYDKQLPVIALDEYKPESHGEDDFSRKQAWFYTYGDEDIKEEFREMFTELIRNHLENDDIKWDFMTTYPTHAEGVVNPNLRDLMMEVASDTEIGFDQVLKRTHTVRESHELQDEKAKVVNLEGSLDVERDLEGKNVIIVDNIALSGVSLLHGATQLEQAGAENVIALSIGAELTDTGSGKISKNQLASQLL